MITSPKMLAILIDNTTRSAAPRRKRRQSSASVSWFLALLAALYFLGRML